VNIVLAKSVKSARKPKGDGHLRRAEILQAAEQIFVRDGYQGATIRKIADEVGVSSTALYMHFRDKDEILLEICEGAIGAVLARNTEISARPIDAVSRVRLMLRDYMRFALDHPNTYWLVFCAAEGPVSEAKSTAVTSLGSRCYDLFHGAVADVEREGRLKAGSATSAAQILWCACHGFGSLRISRPKLDWAADEALMDGMLDGLFHGLITD